MYLPILRVHFKKKKKKKKIRKGLINVFFVCFFLLFFFLIFFIKAYVVGTHLNCIIKSHNICLYKETDKKSTGCNLKTMELLDCEFIWVCLVFRLNTVFCIYVAPDKESVPILI